MKKQNFIIYTLIIIIGIFVFNSCDNGENDKKGFVTFGANYHIINCVTTVAIYLDNEYIGTLPNSTDTIIDCGMESNITKELSIGDHSYKVEIRPENGTGCTKDITGTFTVLENKCEKIFIDYLQVY